jgi:hypothetical protein
MRLRRLLAYGYHAQDDQRQRQRQDIASESWFHCTAPSHGSAEHQSRMLAVVNATENSLSSSSADPARSGARSHCYGLPGVRGNPASLVVFGIRQK